MLLLARNQKHLTLPKVIKLKQNINDTENIQLNPAGHIENLTYIDENHQLYRIFKKARDDVPVHKLDAGVFFESVTICAFFRV